MAVAAASAPTSTPAPEAHPLAIVTLAPIPKLGGSSLATWTYGLQIATAPGAAAAAATQPLLVEALARFLNAGARVSQLRARAADAAALAPLGFARDAAAADGWGLRADRGAALAAADAALAAAPRDAARANVRARLLHDAGDVAGAVDAYMSAVQIDPTRGEVFRRCAARGRFDAGGGNARAAGLLGRMHAPLKGAMPAGVATPMGGAYQSLGQHQMAFASLQQAISLDPADHVAYLKLGMLYEQLALSAGKYEDAMGHAILCYQHYLTGSGTEDTDVLVRMGNLQMLWLLPENAMRRLLPEDAAAPYERALAFCSTLLPRCCHMRRLLPEDAAASYERALAADPALTPAWHNLASVRLRLRDTRGAVAALRRASELDPALRSARHLLASLTGGGEGGGGGDAVARREHARELYDFYADGEGLLWDVRYDDHMRKKLLYTGPRLLRAAIREAANATFAALPGDERAEHGGDVLRYLNASLAVLDLGCGTGLCGSWLKDYAAEAVGVDISQRMVDMATKKGCYTRLVRADMEEFLATAPDESYDLVVAADSLQYVGDLSAVFPQVARVLRPGGWFALTAPLLTAADDAAAADDDDAAQGGGSGGGGARSFRLRPEGTHAFALDYVRAQARAAALDVVKLDALSTRLERGAPLPGLLGVLRRPGEFERRSGAATAPAAPE
ncbi:hypothetical protein JKP88DRAFT_354645 [Tribonema minus]|uniref:Methyltransferase type 11 domain-containing protein n=1 Tax=Tribonema minus TaxID=303371 RepID=A0A835Z5A7_9STRA|nr:hypothetical protein JKP88DRAFT_354645 [Tribonema minus]